MTEIKDDKGIVSTPAGEKTPATPPLESQDILKEIERLKSQNEEAQRKITELSTENSTIKTRMEEVETASYMRPQSPVSGTAPAEPVGQPVNQLENVIKMATSNPEMAFAEIGRMIESASTTAEKRAFEKAQEAMGNKLYLYETSIQAKAKIKDKGMSHWENEILQECDRKHYASNMPYEKIIDKTIAEFEQKRGIDLASAKPPQPKVETPLPSGAKVETGTNTPPPQPQPEVREETRTDYVNNRQNKRLAKVYGLK